MKHQIDHVAEAKEMVRRADEMCEMLDRESRSSKSETAALIGLTIAFALIICFVIIVGFATHNLGTS